MSFRNSSNTSIGSRARNSSTSRKNLDLIRRVPSEQKPQIDLSSIKENIAELSNNENRPQSVKVGNRQNLLDKPRVNSSSCKARKPDQTPRAYEFFKSTQAKKEDIFLQQHDNNLKLQEKQHQLSNQLSNLQVKLKNINDNVQQKSPQKSNDVDKVMRENSQLKRELQAVQLSQSIIQQKNNQKRLTRTMDVEVRDKKKVTDLIRLVDRLKSQLKESEEQMRKMQVFVKGNQDYQISHSDSGQATATIKESNLKVQGLQAKNEDMFREITQLKTMLKNKQQEVSQLSFELKEAREKSNTLGRQNRSLELSVQSAEEYQKQIADLKRQRDQTENRLKELISSPFFRDQGDKASKIVRLQELEENCIRLTAQNEQLTSQMNSKQREIERLADSLDSTKTLLEDLKEENQQFKVDMAAQAQKFGPLQQLQQLDHSTYIKTLGTLTLNSHKNRLKRVDDILNEEEGNEFGGINNSATEVKNLRQEIEQLKFEKGDLAVHLEKLQAMLRIQIEAVHSKDKITSIEKEAADLRYASLLEKAQELAEITDMKGLLTGKVQNDKQNLHKKGNVDYTDTVSVFSDDEDEGSNGIDQSKGQNYFDLWVGSCKLIEANLGKVTNGKINTSNSVLVFSTFDFFDHDTQTTSVCDATSKAFFNFQCSYKLSTKDAFLHYLETGAIQIELYAAFHSEALLLGKAELQLDHLFKQNKTEGISAVLNQRVTIMHKGFGIAEIDIKARLRFPISNQIRFYLDKKNLQLEELSDQNKQQKDDCFDELKHLSHRGDSEKRKLVIAIEKGTNFSTRSSTFVYYSIQGKDYYTRSVSGSNPLFDHHQIIEITNISSFLASLSKFPITFTVFDDLEPFENAEQSNQSDCLGVAVARLEGLAKNQIIDSLMTIESQKKLKVGVLHIKVFWLDHSDEVDLVSKFGDGLLAKQWEKEFTLKIAKAMKARQLNTSNGFMIFDRNNDKVIDCEEFVSSCLGTLNMTEFNKDEVVYFYNKQRQPFNRDTFEAILRPYLIEDKQRMQFIEEMNLIGKEELRREIRNKAAAEFLNMQQKPLREIVLNSADVDISGDQNSLKSVNSLLQKNSDILNSGKLKDRSLQDSIANALLREMRKRSALEVFTQMDSDKDDEVDVNELQNYLLNIGVPCRSDEVLQFLNQINGHIQQDNPSSKGKIDLIGFMNFITKKEHSFTSRIQYLRQYPKVEKSNAQLISEYQNSENKLVSNEQIIHEIEEKIFEYMIQNKLKILKLHEQMDKNKNNLIGKAEFKSFFKLKLGVDLTKRDLDVIFSTFDSDRDGEISVKEFVDHLKAAINTRQSLRDLRSSQSSQLSLQTRGSSKSVHHGSDQFGRSSGLIPSRRQSNSLSRGGQKQIKFSDQI